MAYATHCDREGCNKFQRVKSQFPFLELLRGDEVVAHFCCLDCCMVWSAAHSAPTEVVES
jgi:hypothetical protein